MPVLRGAVTFSRFRAEPAGSASFDPKRLGRGLRARAFEPIDRRSEEDRSAGFVELENHDATGFAPGSFAYAEYALFSYRIDQLKVPGAALRAELEKWAAAFEKENGRPPGRAEKAANRDSLRHMLRARTLPRTRVHDLSWNLKTHQVQIWAASRKVVDEIQVAVEAAFEVKLIPLIPSALAAKSGVEESALVPTPELIGGEVSAEVTHGEA